MAAWIWPDSIICRVIDGDTVEADLVNRHVGFGLIVTFPVRLRLNRINAQPSQHAHGRLCKARVLALTAGARVHITTGKGYKYGAPADRIGEWMAEVLLGDGRNLSDVLVAEGLAVYWDGQGPRPDCAPAPTSPPAPG
jgi:endonuclease YncB( thermonuclease family)